jgi:uncharacterized membrane protein YfcA
MSAISLFFGALVGISLGLTGGGGAIFAVPLLVYGLHVPAQEAVGVSLAAVGATAAVGFLHRWRRGEVEIHTGLVFAVAGMAGAPVGVWISNLFPEPVLLTLFAGLMAVVAFRLWRQASKRPALPPAPDYREAGEGPTCRRDAAGKLVMTSRCAVLLVLLGVTTGMLAGLFGVGGGFVIVPALVLFSGMTIYRAVGTSLMVIALVSTSGVVSRLLGGEDIALGVTALFVAGGVAGLFAGQKLARRLSGPTLQKVFSGAMVAVAAFVLIRNFTT